MTTSRTTSRLIIILLFLAGLLLLRKPVFGQAINVAPTHASVRVHGVRPAKAADVITPSALSRL